MPKKSLVFLLAVLLNFMVTIPGRADQSQLTVVINQQPVNFAQAPVLESGRYMVPVRPFMEAMGADLTWHQESKQLTAVLPGTILTMTVGSTIVKCNEKDVILPLAPRINEGSMLVPLRAIADLSKMSVSWSQDSATISLNKLETKQDAANQAVSETALQANMKRETVHQISTFNALLSGLYDGQSTFNELKGFGDFGIGTLEGLDGEMIELDGAFYQVKADGIAYPVKDTMKTPFASVTFFDADQAQLVKEPINFEQLKKSLEGLISNKNIFYAIKVSGDFTYVKTRSVPGQKKPYPPLVEVTKNQPVFELHKVKGTLVGFWCPAYVEGINVPGYHLHFLTEDHKAGGHLLDFSMQNSLIEIDATPNFSMSLPLSEDFGKMNMAEDRSHETEKVEK